MKKILIVGGYGAVGSTITRKLAQAYPGEVIIAGRNLKKAEQLAKELDHKAVPYQLDLENFKANHLPADLKLVIMCLDQSNLSFVECCIEKGITYIDITANQQLTQQIESLHEKARAKQSTVVLSVGIAPGISNLLAKHCLNQFPEAKELDIFVLLGLGEKHGDAAYRWTFDHFHSDYQILSDNKTETLKSFTSPKSTNLSGKRTAYLFNFSDQHALLKTTTIKQIKTRLAFDSKIITATMALLRKLGLSKVFKNKKVQNLLIPVFNGLSLGSDIFQVKTIIKNDKGIYEASFKGNGEGKATAYVAVQTAVYLLQNPAKPGVWHINQIIDNIPTFLHQLKKYDDTLRIDL